MEKFPRLKAESNIDMEAECLYQYIYGQNDKFYPHSHDYYEIFITISGTVTHQINGMVEKLPEGSLVFIRPDDTHGYRYDTLQSNETAYINLTFTRDTARQLFEYLSESFPSKKLLSCDMPPKVILTSTEKRRLLARISELNVVNWKDKKALKMRMRAILADIFVSFFYDIPDSEGDEIPMWLSNLMNKMQQPENFIAGAERMTEIGKKSREHIARSLKKYCGMTSAEFVNELRLNYASNLILHTNTPVLEICFDCGFQSVSYFYRIFKAKYGVSPKEFRKGI